jgi:hypothetical protein
MPKITNPLKTITCAVKGHQMEISHVVNDRVNELCCTNCGKQMTNTIYGEIVPLDDHYYRINRALAQLARKKMLRIRTA